MLVDTFGLVLGCVVHATDVQDRDGAKWVLACATFDLLRLRIVRGKAAHAGRLVARTKAACHWSLDVIRRTSPGFVVLPKRWLIERPFAWMGKYRRLSKDYEYLIESSKASLHLALIQIMLRRLE